MKIIEDAKKMQAELVEHRRNLHKIPELGMDLPKTVDYVKNELEKCNIEVRDCGESGLVGLIKGKQEGKTFLLRGDMDALPIVEEVESDFKSLNNNMHACGHDFHTAMLLGAAKLLKQNEDKIKGNVKLMFQPGEEIFEGAQSMIKSGILDNPKVDAALMIHVRPGVELEPGSVITTDEIEVAASSDWFKIEIHGKGGHGAMPEKSIDPLNVASNLFTSLQTINSREVHPSDFVVLTIGEMHGGNAANVIPDYAYMSGTIRTYNTEVREFVKNRMQVICKNIGEAFRAKVSVNFEKGCPGVVNDKKLLDHVNQALPKIIGDKLVFNASEFPNLRLDRMSGSEDFAYVSLEVPSVMLRLATGKTSDGFTFPQHHPKVEFDEDALSMGAGVYSALAIDWLENN